MNVALKGDCSLRGARLGVSRRSDSMVGLLCLAALLSSACATRAVHEEGFVACAAAAAAWWQDAPGIPYDAIDPAIAIPLCERAVDREPENGDAWAFLARAFNRAERYQEAWAATDRAVELGSVAGIWSRGVAYDFGNGIATDESEAALWYGTAAEQGYPPAQSNLGGMYDQGRGVEQNDLKAVRWYQLGAEQGFSPAQNNLGSMYEQGLGVEQSDLQAVHWFRRAAERGHPAAQRNLGRMYQEGRGVEQSHLQAEFWYRLAGERGDVDAQLSLGGIYYSGHVVEKDFKEAVRWFASASEQGDPRGHALLAMMYEYGYGVERDDAKAFTLLRLSADQGNAEGMYQLARFYKTGRVVPRDALTALNLYRSASASGQELAVFGIGDLYLWHGRDLDANPGLLPEQSGTQNSALSSPHELETVWSAAYGVGRSQSITEAFQALGHVKDPDLAHLAHLDFLSRVRLYPKLLESSVKTLSDPSTSGSLIEFVLRGSCGPVYEGADSRELLLQIASSNGGRAALELALMLDFGRGIEVSADEAAYWYRRDAENSYIAMVNLGALLATGTGVQANGTEAAEWFERAMVESGGDFAPAAYNLAVAYYEGIGVPENRNYAVELFRKAAERGFAPAQVALGTMYAIGIVEEKNELTAWNWYASAAARGDANAYENIGIMFDRAENSDETKAPGDVWRRMSEIAQRDREGSHSFSRRENEQEGLWIHSGIHKHRNDCELRGDLEGLSLVGFPPPRKFSGDSERKPFSTPDELTESIQSHIVESMIDGLADDRLYFAFEHMEKLAEATGDVYLAVSTRMQSVLYSELKLERQFGARDNYFALLTASCHWGYAANFAHDLGAPAAALYFAKTSVNLLQAARRHLIELDDDLRECFLKIHENRYRWLADLFVQMGRLAEAEQVLGMLKDFEYYEYVRREAGQERALAKLALGRDEAHLDETVQRTRTSFAELGRRASIQRHNTEASEASARQDSVMLRTVLAQAQSDFQARLSEISAELTALGRRQSGRVTERDLQYTGALRGTLRRVFDNQAVVIHTVVLPERTHLILTTPHIQVARTTHITDADLSRKILAFRQTLLNPGMDPRPAGQDLYDLLLKPLESEIEGAAVDVVMLSLDGPLRYLPFAALHDGQSYLAERYSLSLYTDAARDMLVRRGQERWTVAGLGVSEAVDGFDPLPNVPLEIAAIVRGQDGRGALQGEAALDHDFSVDRLNAAIRRYPVVHVASHFKFVPGSEDDSFLLLGGGERLSVRDIRSEQFSWDFGDLDLLTLSACETGLGGGGDGSEIESFAAVVQIQGASAVLATLWPVADPSTAAFMQRFYEIKGHDVSITKASALSMVQREFIAGNASRSAYSPTLGKVRALIPENSDDDHVADPDAFPAFTHPFYWAPFVLMGNWL